MDDEVLTRGVFKKELKKELRKELNAELAKFFNHFAQYFDAKFAVLEAKLDASVARLDEQTAMLVKQADDLRLDNVATQHTLNRHQGWIGQLADKTGTKLNPIPD